MKTLSFIITLMLATGLNMSVNAANSNYEKITVPPAAKTESFKVWGKCNMCKARIEKTVKAEGVTNAEWDVKTQMLNVTYDPSKTNKDALSKKLASVGHDTEKYKAPDDVYAKLPSCCHYERGN